MNGKTFKLTCLLASVILGLLIVMPKASADQIKPTMITLSYEISRHSSDATKKCSLDGYLSSSVYNNHYKTAAAELENYTTCFYYMFDDNYLSFSIAKPFKPIYGQLRIGEKVYLRSSPVNGAIKPKNAQGALYCLGPNYLTDEELTVVINDTLQNYVSGCDPPSPVNSSAE